MADLEPELLKLRDYIRTLDGAGRLVADRTLIDGFDARIQGVLEAIEFTQREFRSEELRTALENRAQNAEDFRRRDLARQLLEVYEPDWPDGEIYATYRDETVLDGPRSSRRDGQPAPNRRRRLFRRSRDS